MVYQDFTSRCVKRCVYTWSNITIRFCAEIVTCRKPSGTSDGRARSPRRLISNKSIFPNQFWNNPFCLSSSKCFRKRCHFHAASSGPCNITNHPAAPLVISRDPNRDIRGRRVHRGREFYRDAVDRGVRDCSRGDPRPGFRQLRVARSVCARE